MIVVKGLSAHGELQTSDLSEKFEGVDLSNLSSIRWVHLHDESPTLRRFAQDQEIFGYVVNGSLEQFCGELQQKVTMKEGQAFVLSSAKGVDIQKQRVKGQAETECLMIDLLPSSAFEHPHFEQGLFQLEHEINQLVPLASFSGDDGALFIRQNCFIYGCRLEEGALCTDVLPPGRFGVMIPLEGRIKIGRKTVHPEEVAIIVDQDEIKFMGVEDSRFLYLDLPIRRKN